VVAAEDVTPTKFESSEGSSLPRASAFAAAATASSADAACTTDRCWRRIPVSCGEDRISDQESDPGRERGRATPGERDRDRGRERAERDRERGRERERERERERAVSLFAYPAARQRGANATGKARRRARRGRERNRVRYGKRERESAIYSTVYRILSDSMICPVWYFVYYIYYN
jgi:hypothetical protein